MFKLFVFAAILAFAASAPAPAPKPGLIAPIAPLTYTAPLSYYNNLPLTYSSLNNYAPGYYNNYYSAPLAYSYYL